MEKKHHLRCAAPICAGDTNPKHKHEVAWYPGEKVCKKTPYQRFQKRQLDINHWVREGKFKNMDEGYTANDLETRSI